MSFDAEQPFAGLELQWIARERLFVDDTYQRLHIRHKNVRSIIANWTPDHFGALNVAPRKDGWYAVMDGQHRLLALDSMGIQPTTPVPCVVHRTPNEPLSFANLNRRAALDAMEEFRARIEGEDPIALELQTAVEKAGFTIAVTKVSYAVQRQEKTVYAIKRLEALMAEHGSEAITDLLLFLEQVWPRDKDAFTSPVLAGVMLFRDLYHDLVPEDTLVEALQTEGPRNLLREAREGVSSRSGPGVASHFAQAIVGAVATVTGKRLPDVGRRQHDRARQRRLYDVTLPVYHLERSVEP